MELNEHFHIRFYDDKEIIKSFRNLYAAKMYLTSQHFIKTWLEIYDSKTGKVVYEIKGGMHRWLD